MGLDPEGMSQELSKLGFSSDSITFTLPLPLSPFTAVLISSLPIYMAQLQLGSQDLSHFGTSQYLLTDLYFLMYYTLSRSVYASWNTNGWHSVSRLVAIKEINI